ncbi:hypothetical protein BX600DRAFT_461794 [Xylariales sp. PMI_506]|nr:hypothetical protein BX600DRAFT_461794 [Xylariales sp. PMI_506]
MAAAAPSPVPLTTVFTPPASCLNRYAVLIDSPTPIGPVQTGIPSSGWIDPLFTECVPSQYTSKYPTFSPGVCPDHMVIVSSTSSVIDGKTVWTGACCESGFSPMEINPKYFCTSSVTTPMAFLIDPSISTADVYTTLSNLWIEHDQITVQWEESDLVLFPSNVALQYASIMGVQAPPISSNPVESSSPSQQASPSATPQAPESTGGKATTEASSVDISSSQPMTTPATSQASGVEIPISPTSTQFITSSSSRSAISGASRTLGPSRAISLLMVISVVGTFLWSRQ